MSKRYDATALFHVTMAQPRTCILFVLAGICFSTHGFFFGDSKVCYDAVGCFSIDHPFDNSYGELPGSPKDVNARAFLWTQKNRYVGQELDSQVPDSISDSNFDPSRPTKVLIHGFMSSKEVAPNVANLSLAFLQKHDYNVIGIDWSDGAKEFYPKAVANTRVTGAVVAQLLETLIHKFGLDLGNIHIIGHSLGAHIAGYVGRRIPGIARITGLDPAGPMFSKTDPVVRLDPTDAIFVDVIHSDGAPLQNAGFGTLEALGHQDFYPNGGAVQPGCPPPVKTTIEELLTGQFTEAFDSVSCAHDRAAWYFIESVLDDTCKFQANPCSTWKQFEAGQCNTCGKNTCPSMGIEAPQSKARGSFYLQTNPDSPFCMNNRS